MKLFLKNLLFTVVVPGTVGVYVPLWLERGRIAPAGANRVAGLLLLAAGALLYAWCTFNFAVIGRGTPAPIDAPTRLVVVGPHRYVGNPMYLAVLAVIAGWAVYFLSLRLAAYAVLVLLAFHAAVLVLEEPALSRAFGSEFTNYRRNVRRWLPRFSGWRA